MTVSPNASVVTADGRFPVRLGGRGGGDFSSAPMSAGDKTPADGAGSAARRWAAFFIGLAAIVILAFVITPFINTLPGVREHIARIRAYDMSAGGYFYTDTEEVFESYNYLRDNEDYSAKR